MQEYSCFSVHKYIVSKFIESVAVIKVAIGVKRAEEQDQDHDKHFTTFTTCVCSKALSISQQSVSLNVRSGM